MPVNLHIYDVGTSGRGAALNWLLSPLGAGAFHCGVEVYDWEWSFSDIAGAAARRPGTTGVFCCRPRNCDGHSYCQSLPMGDTATTEVEVLKLISLLEKQWPVSQYDILTHNCCHFSNELCQRLGVGGIPAWVLNLAGVGAAIEKGTNDVVSMRCCNMIAGEAQDVLCQRDEKKMCCRVMDPEEETEDSDIHYLL